MTWLIIPGHDGLYQPAITFTNNIILNFLLLLITTFLNIAFLTFSFFCLGWEPNPESLILFWFTFPHFTT
jgi:hypothetical protein